MSERQMTAIAGASSTWKDIDWSSVENQVRQLQMRIAKAAREKRYGKVKALQWILTHSYYAKLLAIKRVTGTQGSKTPGVDKVVWNTPKQKMQAVELLRRRGYKPKPLRRVYIPKRKGHRPLDIPAMSDRGQQALYLLALEPVAETLADNNAYGFRPKRCTVDAMEQCMLSLWHKGSAKWILEGDIKSCFNEISHQWLLENIPMDKGMLEKWLKAGYIEQGAYFPMEAGVAQGSTISPAILVITLSGLERAVDVATKRTDKARVISYADDFVVTGITEEVLAQKVKPAIEAFLQERGLKLSQEKTKITHITEGFDFLGFNIRKYKSGKVLAKPSKTGIKRFLSNLREVIKRNRAVATEVLIRQLNPKIKGWAYYYRSVAAKRTFTYVDKCIFEAIWRWIHHRHTRKSNGWRRKRYFRSRGLRNWVFSTKIKGSKSNPKEYLDLAKAADVSIKRHIKIIGAATPYDPKFAEYFKHREAKPYRGKAIVMKECVNPYL